ncbi:hypothetical protein B0T26DRAFT_679679 [Lasiosphaeria miniovina]|uniref:Uncharacterized protein n=1 Tax=Lasiosphaeria miniovina TaxID=1954250 RepID=A0AA39ZYB7_9PEZI|nr:uncharacterized protein B0T26DRAFT_679679 [Lasiosphaeria miniovina]KAK0705902.1 hypothetical protein B0T26DRAFT_679679 [Lasiosphaeria miniovina]
MGTIIITRANGSLAVPAVEHLLTNASDSTLVLKVRTTGRDCQAPDARVSIRALGLAHLDAAYTFVRAIATEVAQGTLPPLQSIVCNAYYWNLARHQEQNSASLAGKGRGDVLSQEPAWSSLSGGS